jgi:hypothetical protein
VRRRVPLDAQSSLLFNCWALHGKCDWLSVIFLLTTCFCLILKYVRYNITYCLKGRLNDIQVATGGEAFRPTK